jgi:hypothetical protein
MVASTITAAANSSIFQPFPVLRSPFDMYSSVEPSSPLQISRIVVVFTMHACQRRQRGSARRWGPECISAAPAYDLLDAWLKIAIIYFHRQDGSIY